MFYQNTINILYFRKLSSSYFPEQIIYIERK